MVTTLPLNYVEVPAPAVAVGGVLAAARVVPAASTHDLGGAQYLTDACAEGNVWLEFCFDAASNATKEFADAPEVVEGAPFAVYAGVGCDLARPQDSATRARNRLDYTERHQIDLHVVDWLGTNSADLGGPLPIARAIGILENYIAAAYGGVPVLYIPRVLIPEAAQQGLVTPSLNGGLVTAQGSVVANVDVDPTTTTFSIFASGQITLIRGPLIEALAPAGGIQADGTAANPSRALAERIYVPLIECVAARLTVCDADCGTTP